MWEQGLLRPPVCPTQTPCMSQHARPLHRRGNLGLGQWSPRVTVWAALLLLFGWRSSEVGLKKQWLERGSPESWCVV